MNIDPKEFTIFARTARRKLLMHKRLYLRSIINQAVIDQFKWFRNAGREELIQSFRRNFNGKTYLKKTGHGAVLENIEKSFSHCLEKRRAD